VLQLPHACVSIRPILYRTCELAMSRYISRLSWTWGAVALVAVAASIAPKTLADEKPAESKLAETKTADDAKKPEAAKESKKDKPKPRSLFDGKELGDWKESSFPSQGRVEVKDKQIIIGFGEGCSGITYKGKFPTTNYELSLEAMRVDGSDFFCGLTFPVKPAADHPRLDPKKKDEVWPCTLVIGGWGGGVLGLSSVDGNDASENATSQYKEFESGKWYKVRLRVTEKKVEAWLDKEKVIDFTIGNRKLSVRIEVEESKPLGIATWRTTGAVRNLEVVTVDEPDSPPEMDDE
jgi:hypothetical protein